VSTKHESAGRVGALDGFRGLVIVSVVVNHAAGLLWPRGWAYDLPVLRGFLGGGAVVVFFVVGAFIVAYGLMKDHAAGALDPVRFYLRRLVRLGVQLVPLCAAVWVLSWYDDTSASSDREMAHNVGHVLTYTQNLWSSTDILGLELRPEFGHLWYLSVQQQCYLVLPLAVALLARWRPVFVVWLVVLMGAVYYWRQVTLAEAGWVQASSLTTTRADGLLWGVALAVALPWLARVRGWGHVLWVSGLLLLVLKLSLPELSAFAYLGPWSVAFTLVSGVVVVALWNLDTPTRVSRALSWRPVQRLGKASLAVFIWHLPVIIVVSRHTADWHWQLRALLAAAVLAVIVVAMERWVDEPVRRLLATNPGFRLAPAPVAERIGAGGP
jgi:peptidoglycan/LPS O-acetylase OafA/YrhL